MAQIAISARAKLELEEIWLAIALDNPVAADKVLHKIGRQIDQLRDFPELGTLRRDIGFAARMLVQGNYLILYEHRSDESVVEIVSIVDGRRDLNELF